MDQEKQLQEQGSLLYTVRLAVIAAMGGLLFGFDWAVISGTTTYIETYFADTMKYIDVYVADTMKCIGVSVSTEGLGLGIAVSSALFGCIMGVCASGMLSDRLGRKRVLIIAALLFMISAILTAVPKELWLFVMARLIGGVAIGLSSPVAPMYIAEMAPEKSRGALVTMNQLAITFGIVVAYFCDWFIAGMGSEAWGVTDGWRWMFVSEVPPAALFLVALMFVPESPRWLAKEGRWDQAERILARIGGQQRAEQELQSIRVAVTHEATSIGQLLRPGMRKALLIGVGIMIFSQITGNFAVFTYTPKLLKQLGSEGTNWDLFGMVMVGVVNFLTTIVAVCLIDKLGRRPLLIYAPLGMCLFMAALAGSFQLGSVSPALLLGCILGFVVCYAIGVGPGAWLIISEIFPTRVRGRAMSICTLSLWVVNFLTTLAFPVLWSHTQAGTFWLFALTSGTMALFVWAILPETKGRSLEEIEQSWLEPSAEELR
ncbi:MAG: sugar porter family MFS transporter [Candidatus Nealsonbacteria bacterium]|nr:sugar porter family MFS transporter [Candidatus Nealsonbacteria bacterium]